MKLHGKYYGSLFIALCLLSLANLALADLNSHDGRMPETDCFVTGASSANPAKGHSLCSAEDADVNDFASCFPFHLQSNLLSCVGTPLTTRLEIMESYKELPLTYASIFVPPQ